MSDPAAQTEDGHSAAATLERLQRLLGAVHALGLDPVYENDSKRKLVQDVKPPGMNRDTFENAIKATPTGTQVRS